MMQIDFSELFISSIKAIDPYFTKLLTKSVESNIKKQLEDSDFTDSYETAVENTNFSLLIGLIVFFVLNYVL
jgi:hypothetical protein